MLIKRKIVIVVMLGLILVGVFSGCRQDSNELETSITELEVDYVVNDDGTYSCNDIIYNYRIEVFGFEGEKQVTFIVLANDKAISFDDITYGLKKAEVSTGKPEFVVLGWY